MTRQSATSAKLVPPKLFGVVPRERLFSMLDQQLRHSAVWVAGPPGIGKTTLVASYVEDRGLPALWYQIDAGDCDPAAFFYYLREATCRAMPRKKVPLPLLTPEYLADIPAYTRRFFRQLVGMLPRPFALVFDNWQAIPATPIILSAWAAAVDEMVDGISIITISRTDPPPEAARLIASRALTVLDEAALRLTLNETTEIALAEGQTDQDVVKDLHETSAGWAAGVTLMLAHYRRKGHSVAPEFTSSRQMLFDYFLSEIFANIRPQNRELLLRTAFLPRMTAPMAAEIGAKGAEELLEYLCRHHYFTNRFVGNEVTYQYHALFREFLLAKAEELLSAGECEQLARQAGGLLCENGDPDSALPLYVQAGDWQAATELILREAPTLLAQGRGQTLGDWIDALPAERIESEPWLLYWQGSSQIHTNPVGSRRHLERAFENFSAAADCTGQALAAAAIVQTYYFEGSDFSPLDKWLPILARILAQQSFDPTPEIELKVYTGLLMAMVYRQPFHAMCDACTEKIFHALQSQLDINQRVVAAFFLLTYCLWLGQFDRAQRIIAIVDPLMGFAEVSASSKALWQGRVAYHWLMCGAYEKALICLAEGHRIVASHGLTSAAPLLHWFQAHIVSHLRNAPELETLVERFSATMNPARRLDQGYGRIMNANLAILRGDLVMAVQEVRAAVELVDQAGFVFARLGFRVALAQVLADCGETEEAAALIGKVRAMLRESPFAALEWWLKLVEAYVALQRGDVAACHEALGAGFGLARRIRYYFSPVVTCQLMPRLCAEALDAGIEVDYVRSFIRGCRLPPPSADVDRWPWPIKIYCLGRFAIVLDDVPLQFSGKAQKRPLDLLKCLIALGGRDVSSTIIMENLWPDAEGDAGQKAFEATLHRLRKMLGRDDALLLSDGKLTLDARLAWVDVWVFERLVGNGDRAQDQAGRALRELRAESPERVFCLYQGHFLAREEEAPWMLGMREKLKSKLLRHLLWVGQQMEVDGLWDQAADLYQRGLEHDNLAEELYRRLMITYEQRAQPAGAVEVYRRCRQMFSVVLGVKPSSETEALYRRFKSG